MPNVIHHPHQPHKAHHHTTLYFVLASLIMFALIITLSIVPTITLPGRTINPAYYSETTRLNYLHGEKVMYTNPVALQSAFVAYRAGEKIVYNIDYAVLAYRLGEKGAVLGLGALNTEDALYLQRMGEKAFQ